tara:strand:- start:23289 stop:23936 length:648 start_codon:yes stop_codon:yes gene_type:complete
MFLFSIGFVTISHAQIDNNSGLGRPINAQESNNSLNNPFSNSSSNRSLSNNESFLNTKENPKPLDSNKEKNFDMTTDNGLKTKKFDYKPSWLTSDKEIKEEYYKGQLLGTFGTKSKTIEILCRDHQYVDGDRVRILVNDQVIIHNVNLRADFQSFVVDLKPGKNVIQFQALNQGTSGPNTAHFKVFDQNNNVITENEWNLATGVKASLVVIQEEN